jgi:hypothetical protein
VIKHVINDNGGTAVASDFTMVVEDAINANPASFAGVEVPGTTVSLNVGPYSVDESGPSGYAKSFSGDCSGPIALAETKTCTVTNDDVPRGSIIVEKQTIPGGAAGSFTFTGNAAGSISDNEQIVATNLQAGPYTSTEVDLPAGFSLTSVFCDDALSATPSEVDLAERKVTFHVDPDEVVKCTFTNTLESTPPPSPTPSSTETTTAPTETTTATAIPTETAATPPPTATAAPGPVVLPTAVTPKPTPTPASPIVAPATPVAPPPSGSGGSSGTMDWSWTALCLIGAALLMLAGARLAVQSRKRRNS